MPHGGTLTLLGQGTPTEVHLRIRDTGSGIPAASLPKIFEPLYTTKPGGTGLGLHIVQEIVTAHAGRLSVESVAGQGTTFTISLPCEAEGTSAASRLCLYASRGALPSPPSCICCPYPKRNLLWVLQKTSSVWN
jgi:K+-sensing histidine kinase KdpD